MNPTRREFVLAAGATLALAVLPGQTLAARRKKGEAPGDNEAGDLAKAPFTVGPLGKYRNAGLYRDAKDQGVWLVSDGVKLIALSSVCTHNGCPVDWNPDAKEFQCPCHHSQFMSDGLLVDDKQKARRPLERCKLTLVDGPDGAKVVQVDPTKLFVQDKKKDEFSQEGAYLPFG